MNRTKIEWTDFTWNPITGCLNNCSYCYARKMYHRFGRDFTPQFHPERLSEPFKAPSGSKIFVCSVAEPFGWWVKEEWLLEIMKVINKNLDINFLFLTKCPQNIKKMFPKAYWWIRGLPNVWLGVSVTSDSDLWRIEELDRIDVCGGKFVSFEPLLKPVYLDDATIWAFDWMIIGSQTQPLKLPERKWVDELVFNARLVGIPVFLKNNLRPIFSKDDDFPQEFPRQLVSLTSSNEQTNILGR